MPKSSMKYNPARHSIFHYLNPILWIREIFSYLMTVFLFFNRFFTIIFGCFVVFFIVFFFYDRYSNFTYGDSNNQVSSFKVGFFKDTQKYASPLTRKDENLSKKLSAFYASKMHLRKKTEKKENSDEQVMEETQPKEQSRRADLNPNTAQNQIATKSYQDHWETRPYKSIQTEVRRRTAKGRK